MCAVVCVGAKAGYGTIYFYYWLNSVHNSEHENVSGPESYCTESLVTNLVLLYFIQQ